MNEVANILIGDLKAHDNQLWNMPPIGGNIFEKLILSKKGKELVSKAIKLLLENGITPFCSVSMANNSCSPEIISLSAIEFADLIHKLKKL